MYWIKDVEQSRESTITERLWLFPNKNLLELSCNVMHKNIERSKGSCNEKRIPCSAFTNFHWIQFLICDLFIISISSLIHAWFTLLSSKFKQQGTWIYCGFLFDLILFIQKEWSSEIKGRKREQMMRVL